MKKKLTPLVSLSFCLSADIVFAHVTQKMCIFLKCREGFFPLMCLFGILMTCHAPQWEEKLSRVPLVHYNFGIKIHHVFSPSSTRLRGLDHQQTMQDSLSLKDYCGTLTCVSLLFYDTFFEWLTHLITRKKTNIFSSYYGQEGRGKTNSLSAEGGRYVFHLQSVIWVMRVVKQWLRMPDPLWLTWLNVAQPANSFFIVLDITWLAVWSLQPLVGQNKAMWRCHFWTLGQNFSLLSDFFTNETINWRDCENNQQMTQQLNQISSWLV